MFPKIKPDQTIVINLHTTRMPYDMYIGRIKFTQYHYGNPFSHLDYVTDIIKVKNRKEAVNNYRAWLDGSAFQEVDPERRQWILDNLYKLRGKVLGCFCAPAECHGHVLKEMADGIDLAKCEDIKGSEVRLPNGDSIPKSS